jgi:dipeptidyl aminopeptidase/acylaminoacyl peptidase
MLRGLLHARLTVRRSSLILASFMVVMAQCTWFNVLPVSAGTYEKIFFSDNGTEQIYSINPDGSNPVVIGEGYDPSVSPDGSKILYNFFANTPGNYDMDLFTRNSAGNVVNLTNTPNTSEDRATWSPDGQYILYRSFTLSPNVIGGYFVMNADGSNQRRILPNAEWASYSPDGSKIVFANWDSGGITIAVANADGSNLTTLFNNGWGNYEPAWSPNGQYIAWRSYCQSPDPVSNTECISIMNSDGSNPHDIVKSYIYNGGDDYSQPAWSPDSSHIVMTGWDNALFTVPANGGSVQTIYTTTGPPNSQLLYPTWVSLNDEIPPTVFAPLVTPPLVITSGTLSISASATDTGSGIQRGEFYIDTDPGQGNGTPMTYDPSTGKVVGEVTLSSTNSSDGLHTVYIRAVDWAGNWSTTVSAVFIKS